MDRDEAITLLKGGPEGIQEWNRRRQARELIPILDGSDFFRAKLSGANLGGAKLSGANLSVADLNGANLSGANLNGANLNGANLSGANLNKANLNKADLGGADLSAPTPKAAKLNGANLIQAHLGRAQLGGAELGGANLSQANLLWVNLHRNNLREANFTSATFGSTTLGHLDLSEAKSLDLARHEYPSTIGLDTLIKSQGKIPDAFLRGCGVPEDWIVQIPSLIGMMQQIQFYSCFISYSTKDEEFAQRLHSRMVHEKLRVWYSPVDIQGGKILHEQVDEAIRVHDKLLLVISPSSISSDWVKTEIRKARRLERQDGKRRLFPVRLVDFKAIEGWEFFDGGEDLAARVREYFIPDFSNWKDHDAF